MNFPGGRGFFKENFIQSFRHSFVGYPQSQMNGAFFHFICNCCKTECGTDDFRDFTSNSEQNPAMQKRHPSGVPFGFPDRGKEGKSLFLPFQGIHHEVTCARPGSSLGVLMQSQEASKGHSPFAGTRIAALALPQSKR